MPSTLNPAVYTSSCLVFKQICVGQIIQDILCGDTRMRSFANRIPPRAGKPFRGVPGP